MNSEWLTFSFLRTEQACDKHKMQAEKVRSGSPWYPLVAATPDDLHDRTSKSTKSTTKAPLENHHQTARPDVCGCTWTTSCRMATSSPDCLILYIKSAYWQLAEVPIAMQSIVAQRFW